MSNTERRFSNITGGWKRDMVYTVGGPEALQPILFKAAKAVMSFVGCLRHPVSTTIIKEYPARRSLVAWTDG